MANNIALQTLLAESLDKKLVASTLTSWMEANAAGVKYNGGNKFQFAKIDMDDIADYNRADGFTTGSVTLTYEQKEFKWDWGKSFLIDSMDVDESNFIATATNVLGEFNRTKVAPKVDKTRLAEIVNLATNKEFSKTGTYKEVLAAINACIAETGLNETDIIVHISRTAYNTFCADKEVAKVVSINGSAISLNTNVKTVNGATLIVTPDSLMGNAAIIACAKTAPMAIAKHSITNIFTPEVNQTADAYRVNERLYHTLEIKDNQLPAVYVGMKTAE